MSIYDLIDKLKNEAREAEIAEDITKYINCKHEIAWLEELLTLREIYRNAHKA